MADANYVYGIHESGGGKYAYAERITIDRNNERDPQAQLKAGGDFRQKGDDGMHLISRVANGSKGEENLIAGDHSINRGSYKSMENSVIRAVENTPDGNVSMRVDTFGGKDRPDIIQVHNTLTDKDGNIIDRQNESWSNQSNELNNILTNESGTDFWGYQENLTKEERALADEVQSKIDLGTIKVNTGLDTGWQYHQFNTTEDPTMGKAHDDFVKGLKVDTSISTTQSTTSSKNTTGGREHEGYGMGGRDDDYKSAQDNPSKSNSVSSGANTNSIETMPINPTATASETLTQDNSVGAVINDIQSETSAALEGVDSESTAEGMTESSGVSDGTDGLSGEDGGIAGP